MLELTNYTRSDSHCGTKTPPGGFGGHLNVGKLHWTKGCDKPLGSNCGEAKRFGKGWREWEASRVEVTLGRTGRTGR